MQELPTRTRFQGDDKRMDLKGKRYWWWPGEDGFGHGQVSEGKRSPRQAHGDEAVREMNEAAGK